MADSKSTRKRAVRNQDSQSKVKQRTFSSGMVAGILLGIVVTTIAIGYVQTKVNLFSSLQSVASSANLAPTQTSSQAATAASQLSASGNNVRMIIPAVDNNGNGVTTVLNVGAKPGTGKILIDVNNLFFFVDTQNSIKTATEVAQNISGVDLSKVDLTYSVDANVSAVEGPSAGAALTIATIAAVEGKPLNSSVMITGTINPDGSIGQIGGVLEKAQAAKSVGASLLLVPIGQSTSSTYNPVQSCRQVGPITYCTTDYTGTKTDVSTQAGITIKEVGTIENALRYFSLL